jgi:hypothetical protein
MKSTTKTALQRVANWSPAVAVMLLLCWLWIYPKFGVSHPPVGFYIAVLAFVAAIVSIMPPDNNRARAGWFIFFGAVLCFEISTLYQQRAEDIATTDTNRKLEDAQVATTRALEDDRFAKILQSQQDNFATVLRENQKQFNGTVGKLNSLSTVSDATNGLARESLAKLKEREGSLIPGSSPSPPPPKCYMSRGEAMPKIDMLVLFGSAAGINIKFPFSMVAEGDVKLLWIDRDSHGGLLVNAIVFDDRGDIIAKIESNTFMATYSASRIDKTPNRLVVYDHHASEALYVEFVNPSAIVARANMFSPRGVKVVANNSGISYGGMGPGGVSCIINGGGGFIGIR